MSNAKVRLSAALTTALAQVEELMGEPFALVPRLILHEDAAFWALCEVDGKGLTIRVSEGVVAAFDALWAAFLATQAERSDALLAQSRVMADLSLVWLMLHEMQHHDLRHFEIIGRGGIAETRAPQVLALVERHVARPNLLAGFGPAEMAKVDPCLELQADHDAIELLIDAYSTEEWKSLRHRAAAVAAMMVLIEVEDSRHGGALSTHPKAATRIFQLLGHVAEMPFLPARFKAEARGADTIDPADLPHEDEVRAFGEAVTLPLYRDSIGLAAAAGALAVQNDLGSAEAFFDDIEIASVGNPRHFRRLKTAGAKQWADFVRTNVTILERLGLADL
ncbi:hypothetical protein [uncultured Albimonas sp.]|uniref:hypothetical protein n=1 Tax=uncultured Albimonas sp. TaxID=1331701 RepID=UPI0030EB7D9F